MTLVLLWFEKGKKRRSDTLDHHFTYKILAVATERAAHWGPQTTSARSLSLSLLFIVTKQIQSRKYIHFVHNPSVLSQ